VNMTTSNLLTADFKNHPYWWDRAPPLPVASAEVPTSTDVAIVGSGLTALSAALTLLRAGREVVVFDSEDPGFGASRRNAGYLGRTLKKSFPELMKTLGQESAVAVYRELDAALQTTLALITDEGIDCYAARRGRFVGATSAAHYDKMASELEITKRYLGFDFHMVPKSDQRDEIASDLYHGGAVIPDLGSLHAGLYHKGLLERVLAAGGILRGQTEVRAVERDGRQFRLLTSAETVVARDVIVATNGYTPRGFHWHARRVIPFTAYMAATEVLAEEQLRHMIPHERTMIDSNLNVNYVRPAPDTSRLLFGGATGSKLGTVDAIASRLGALIVRILPDLAGVRFSHLWTGRCAGTFDMMPHMGCHDGIWYGMGYNFAGVPMGTYFGRKIAQQILGLPEGRTVFHSTRFPTVPLYNGNPWFVPYAMSYFDWRDRRDGRAHRKTSA
jgi:glycine/D-amino acid oxidase-like deaminating enzyme